MGGLDSLLTSMLSSFASAFEQTSRLLKLNFAEGSGIPANLLLPHRLTGREAIMSRRVTERPKTRQQDQ